MTPWTAAYQAPESVGFPRQEYWSGVPLPSLGNRLVVDVNSAEVLVPIVIDVVKAIGL